MNQTAFDKLIASVANGEVMAITKNGETIAVMIQPELLGELRQELLNRCTIEIEHSSPVTKNIFEEE